MTRPPDAKYLRSALAGMLEGDASAPLHLLSREPNPYASSASSELVTCQLSGGHRQELFCKYGPVTAPENHGHRGGLAYEALVYREVLAGSLSGPPAFRGAFSLSSTELGLVVDGLRHALRAGKWPTGDGVARAAAWIGRFHARHELSRGVMPSASLRRHDLEYFVGWARRAQGLAADGGGVPNWLRRVCDGFESLAPRLIDRSLTIVHGEYYPQNVLVTAEGVHPVDWESAALAPGEIDLAALTEDWPDDVVRQCEAAYQHNRWPEGTPVGFDESLLVARLYLQLRWLGDRREWALRPEQSGRRWSALRSIGERLGLIVRTDQ
jgi:hypothetical protein